MVPKIHADENRDHWYLRTSVLDYRIKDKFNLTKKELYELVESIDGSKVTDCLSIISKIRTTLTRLEDAVNFQYTRLCNNDLELEKPIEIDITDLEP